MRNVYVEREKALTSFYTLCKKTSITHGKSQRQPPFLSISDPMFPIHLRLEQHPKESKRIKDKLSIRQEKGEKGEKKKKTENAPIQFFLRHICSPFVFCIVVDLLYQA